MLNRLMIAMALAAGLGATAAAQTPAAPPSPNVPPGPASTAREVLEPWIKANVRDEGWRPIGANAVNEFMAPKAFVKGADGKVRTQIRLERFEPAEIQGFVWRSAIQGVEFDCAAQNLRFLYISAFPGLNLQGVPRRFEIGNPAPTPAASVPALGQIQQAACATTARSWPAEPAPAATAGTSPPFAWLAETIDQGDWRLAVLSPLVATYTNPTAPTTPEGWREARIRSEFLKPEVGPQGVPRRSELVTLNVDCAKASFRIVSVATHIQQNLLGANQVANGPPDWRMAPDNSPLAAAGRAACGAAWTRPAQATVPAPTAAEAAAGAPLPPPLRVAPVRKTAP